VQTEPLEPEYDHIRMKARDAVEVFESFEDDVDHDDLTDSEKVKEILRYVDDRKDRCFWKSMDGYDERDYMVFKGSVLEHYLGIRKTTRYYLEQQFLFPLFPNCAMAKEIRKRILRRLELKDQEIPPMKRAFKRACHVVEEMLEEDDEDDMFGWPLGRVDEMEAEYADFLVPVENIPASVEGVPAALIHVPA